MGTRLPILTKVIALEIFNEQPFDLIILDIMLPEISGLDICRSMKKIDVPIIMVTAKDSEVDRVTGLEMGVTTIFTKPFQYVSY